MIDLTSVGMFEAITQNNVSGICKLLDSIGLTRDSGQLHYTPDTRQMLQVILTTASAMASVGKLSDELAEELVIRIAPCCEIFPLLRTVAIVAEIETDNYDAVPKNILWHIVNDDYFDSETMENIENLDTDAIRALISWALSDKSPSGIFIAFNRPFFACIRKRAIVPAANLLAFMAGTLREPHIDPVYALAELFG